MSDTRPIRFAVLKPLVGSTVVREVMAERMRALGSDVAVIQQDRDALDRLTGAVAVLVREFDPTVVDSLRARGNIVVWHAVDWFAVKDELPDLGGFNGAVFPNERARQDFTYLLDDTAQTTVIGAFADPRWRQADAWRYRLGYLGGYRNLPEEFRRLRGLHKEYIRKGKRHLNRFFRRSRRYACHFSVRVRDRDTLYKPPTKVAGAAACNANIILSRAPAHLEFLPPDYPYFTDSDLESVRETVKFARDSYRGTEWRRGLEMMREVRAKTSFDRIVRDHLDFYRSFD